MSMTDIGASKPEVVAEHRAVRQAWNAPQARIVAVPAVTTHNGAVAPPPNDGNAACGS